MFAALRLDRIEGGGDAAQREDGLTRRMAQHQPPSRLHSLDQLDCQGGIGEMESCDDIRQTRFSGRPLIGRQRPFLAIEVQNERVCDARHQQVVEEDHVQPPGCVLLERQAGRADAGLARHKDDLDGPARPVSPSLQTANQSP